MSLRTKNRNKTVLLQPLFAEENFKKGKKYDTAQ